MNLEEKIRKFDKRELEPEYCDCDSSTCDICNPDWQVNNDYDYDYDDDPEYDC